MPDTDPLATGRDEVSDDGESIHDSVDMDDCDKLLSDHSNDHGDPETEKDNEIIIANR